MAWIVVLHEAFEREFQALPPSVKVALAARARLVETIGPALGRPHVDTLKASKYKNMKELRFDAAGGTWRAAFAFDTKREAILLCAADKSGGSEARFYRVLIAKADERLSEHLASLKDGA